MTILEKADDLSAKAEKLRLVINTALEDFSKQYGAAVTLETKGNLITRLHLTIDIATLQD